MNIVVHTPVEAREAVHVLLLKELTRIGGGHSVILKGGVNLRLFFASIRYSEDMDLDGEPEFSSAIRGTIRNIFEDRGFLNSLRSLGLRGLDPGKGVNKDTDTVFRHKFHVIGRGDIRYPTKVEVSFRPRFEQDIAVAELVPSSFVEDYVGPRAFIRVPHYNLPAAVRQKVEALAGRTVVQARDVLDLHVLGLTEPCGGLVMHVGQYVGAKRLDLAIQRTYEITFEEFEGQVVEFLADEARDTYGTREAWDEVRLRVAGAIEAAAARGREVQ